MPDLRVAAHLAHTIGHVTVSSLTNDGTALQVRQAEGLLTVAAIIGPHQRIQRGVLGNGHKLAIA